MPTKLKSIIREGLNAVFFKPNRKDNLFAYGKKGKSKYFVWCKRDGKGWKYERYKHQPSYDKKIRTFKNVDSDGSYNLDKFLK